MHQLHLPPQIKYLKNPQKARAGLQCGLEIADPFYQELPLWMPEPIPDFSGGDPNWWLMSACCYFLENQIPFEDRVSYVICCLEGEAQFWFRWKFQKLDTFPDWRDFKAAVQERFGNNGGASEEELNAYHHWEITTDISHAIDIPLELPLFDRQNCSVEDERLKACAETTNDSHGNDDNKNDLAATFMEKEPGWTEGFNVRKKVGNLDLGLGLIGVNEETHLSKPQKAYGPNIMKLVYSGVMTQVTNLEKLVGPKIIDSPKVFEPNILKNALVHSNCRNFTVHPCSSTKFATSPHTVESSSAGTSIAWLWAKLSPVAERPQKKPPWRLTISLQVHKFLTQIRSKYTICDWASTYNASAGVVFANLDNSLDPGSRCISGTKAGIHEFCSFEDFAKRRKMVKVAEVKIEAWLWFCKALHALKCQLCERVLKAFSNNIQKSLGTSLIQTMKCVALMNYGINGDEFISSCCQWTIDTSKFLCQDRMEEQQLLMQNSGSSELILSCIRQSLGTRFILSNYVVLFKTLTPFEQVLRRKICSLLMTSLRTNSEIQGEVGEPYFHRLVGRIIIQVGGTIQEQLGVSSISLDLVLERICIEGSRRHAKYAVHTLASTTKDDGLMSLFVLYKRLVDILEEKPQFPTVLQSLGCIAKTAMPIFETKGSKVEELGILASEFVNSHEDVQVVRISKKDRVFDVEFEWLRGKYVKKKVYVLTLNKGRMQLYLESSTETRNRECLEVLIERKGLPECEYSWELNTEVNETFPHFHLEDKVNLKGGGVDKSSILQVYMRRPGRAHTRLEPTAQVGE